MDEIEAHLVKTGQYGALSSVLREKLAESGWYDEVLALASRQLSKAADPRPDSPEVAAVRERAMAMIPESVKVEMLQAIFSIVDGLVENA